MSHHHIIRVGGKEVYARCCAEGERLYQAWTEECYRAGERRRMPDALPWNHEALYRAMHAYFIHRNGRWTNSQRWEIEPCHECGYREVVA